MLLIGFLTCCPRIDLTFDACGHGRRTSDGGAAIADETRKLVDAASEEIVTAVTRIGIDQDRPPDMPRVYASLRSDPEQPTRPLTSGTAAGGPRRPAALLLVSRADESLA